MDASLDECSLKWLLGGENLTPPSLIDSKCWCWHTTYIILNICFSHIVCDRIWIQSFLELFRYWMANMSPICIPWWCMQAKITDSKFTTWTERALMALNPNICLALHVSLSHHMKRLDFENDEEFLEIITKILRTCNAYVTLWVHLPGLEFNIIHCNVDFYVASVCAQKLLHA